MTILNTFFDLPFETHRFEKLNGITVTIKYQGEEFIGVAVCHSDDEEFFSPIVGGTIAHYRAMESALFMKIWEMEEAVSDMKHGYACISQSINPAIADPTGKFKKYIYKQENKITKLRQAHRSLKKELNKYLQDQHIAIESISRSRAKSDN